MLAVSELRKALIVSLKSGNFEPGDSYKLYSYANLCIYTVECLWMTALKSVSHSSIFVKPVDDRMLMSQVDAVKHNVTTQLY